MAIGLDLAFELFRERAERELSLTLTEEQITQFKLYYDLIIKKNKVMNLTAITEPEEFIEKHYLDSLTLVRVADLTREDRLLDLGTGAGFPGIPLKIMFPQLRIILADSLQKRLTFLDDVIDRLGLSGIETVHGRAEELGRKKEYRESFTLVVSRAVASLVTLCEYCLPFTAVGGRFIAYKADSAKEECAAATGAIHLLGGRLEQMDTFALGEQTRSLVVIEKERNTPKEYPRKAGTPSKKPIQASF